LEQVTAVSVFCPDVVLEVLEEVGSTLCVCWWERKFRGNNKLGLLKGNGSQGRWSRRC